MRFKGKHYVSKRDLKEDRFQKLVEQAMEYYYRDRQRVWIGAAAVVAVIVIVIVLLQNRGPGVDTQAEIAYTQAIGLYSTGDFGRAETAFTIIGDRYGRNFIEPKRTSILPTSTTTQTVYRTRRTSLGFSSAG